MTGTAPTLWERPRRRDCGGVSVIATGVTETMVAAGQPLLQKSRGAEAAPTEESRLDSRSYIGGGGW